MRSTEVTITDYQSMVVEFQNESDRGAAVLAGCYVENYLGQYLKSKMTDFSVAERIFSSDGSLSTFSQRIDIAQAFGFLSKAQCSDLHLIKKIRNHFAHSPKKASFNTEPVSDWVQNLIASKIKITVPDGTLQEIDDKRLCYLISAGMFIALNMEIK